ncbi:MAG: TIGR03986 family type III CRISPR-associated RAMP protein [Gammaproteobacteria bacterium]
MPGLPGLRCDGLALAATVSEFSAESPVPDELPRQEFVAIDRFTGGAANKKKFNAERPDSVTLHGWIEVEPERICAWGYGLLALVLRDLKEGDIQFGLGRAKGYGSCTAKLVEIGKLAPLLAEKISGPVDPGAEIQFRELVDKAVNALRAEVKRGNPEGSTSPIAAPTREGTAATEPTPPSSAPASSGGFLNPYHFVPLAEPDLEAWHPADKIEAKGALSHAHYAPATHSGRIICRLSAQTPLFVGNERGSKRETSTEGADEAEAKTGQPTPVKPFELNRRPAIPASSLRGMISSLFEAATGSAPRILSDSVLSYRKVAKQALTKIGMLVEEGAGGYSLIPICDRNDWVRLESSRFNHKRSFSLRDPEFYCLSRHDIQEDGCARRLGRNNTWVPVDSAQGFREDIGILYIVGEASRRGRKKYELFLPLCQPIYDALRSGNYKACGKRVDVLREAVERFHELAGEIHELEKNKDIRLEERRPYTPVGRPRDPDRAVQLMDGDILYYETNNRNEAVEFSFSAVWRGRVETGDPGHRRAATVHDFFRVVSPELLPFGPQRQRLSPAESVFGLVAEGDARLPAYASRVRFGFGTIASEPSAAQADGARDYYLPAVTLKQLASPKLPCPAMYFTRDQTPYIPKSELDPARYEQEHLRPQGRKFYLHEPHAGTQRCVYESEKPAHIHELERNHQNNEELRTLKKQIENHVEVTPLPPGTTFYFHVDFDNLKDTELEALCFALQPSAGFHHKLGLGKPLGLGSVQIEHVGAFFVNRRTRYRKESVFSKTQYHTMVRTGPKEWPEAYRIEKTCHAVGIITYFDFQEFRNRFAAKVNPKVANAVAALGAWNKDGLPVRYPPNSGLKPALCEEDLYEWFVGNDGGPVKDDRGRRYKSTDKKPLKPIAASGIEPLKQHDWLEETKNGGRRGGRPRR